MAESEEELLRRKKREASARWYAKNQEEARRSARERASRRYAKDPEKERERSRNWGAENPERKRETNKRWYTLNPAKKLLQQCRGSAKRRGHECTITVEMIGEMLAPMVCSVTGLPLSLDYAGESRNNPWAPSVDRIDSSRGYVLGNVRVVCCAFNLARNEWPDDVLRTLFEAALRALR